MPRACEICGKKTATGRQIARRGMAKRVGGVGRKVTGITIRKFRPNLQKVRAIVDGTVRRIRVCTTCLTSGKIKKPE